MELRPKYMPPEVGGSFYAGTAPAAMPNANLAVGSITIDLP